MDAQNKNIGKITQVIGAVVDVKFTEASIPSIYNALNATIEIDGKVDNIVLEVQQQLGGEAGRHD